MRDARRTAGLPSDAWRVVSTFRPGEKGTKRLLRDWGARLVCVRYRYNSRLGKRVKTAEIVIEEVPWRRRPARLLGIGIRSWESVLRQAIVKEGGTWDPELKVWVLSQKGVNRLRLAARARKLERVGPNAAASHLSGANIHGNRKPNTYGNLPLPATNSGNRQ